MPIVEEVPPGAPLNQGDILVGIRLFSTANSWAQSGGEHAKAPFNLCVVLSRPCVAEHKGSVVVAAVDIYKRDVPRDADSFHKVKEFLTGLRDGYGSPDIFYLGQLPGLQGRYSARFDSMHTVQVPAVGANREQFLKASRIGRLSKDFARDLHSRLFGAFASLGFDDVGWLSDQDLAWLVARGRADEAKAESSVGELRTQKASQGASGQQFSAKDLEKQEANLDTLKAELGPYVAEFQRRGLSG